MSKDKSNFTSMPMHFTKAIISIVLVALVREATDELAAENT